jgi:hypothetical protein
MKTTSGRDEDEQEQVLVNAVRTKFTVRVNFVVVFGGGRGDETDKSNDSLSTEKIETEEHEGDPKLAVYRCNEDDDDEQDWSSATTDDIVITVCIESRDASQWTIDNVLESSLRVSGVSAVGIEDETSVRGVSSASSSANQTFSMALVQEDEPPIPSWQLISSSCHHHHHHDAAAAATTCRIQIAVGPEAATATAIVTLSGTATLVSTRSGARETHDFVIAITDYLPAHHRSSSNNNSAAAPRLGSTTGRTVTFMVTMMIMIHASFRLVCCA